MRLHRLQWFWNFAPLRISCLFQKPPPTRATFATTNATSAAAVAMATATKPWLTLLRERVCADGNSRAKSGAVRVAFNMGLKMIDTYGYGLPFPLSRCTLAAGDAELAALSLAAPVAGTGGADGVIEVVRISLRVYGRRQTRKATLLKREGGPNGCWFIARRGTGVFLRTGRTLRVSGRPELMLALQINRTMIIEAARAQPRKMHEKFVDELVVNGSFYNLRHAIELIEDIVPLCPVARAWGYQTIVLGHDRPDYVPEVVSCAAECVARPLDGACVPGLLTGWRASLPCACNDSLPIVNCMGTPAPGPARHRVPFVARMRPAACAARTQPVGPSCVPAC